MAPKRKLNFTVSEEILQLAKRRKKDEGTTKELVKKADTPKIPPLMRQVYRSEKTMAALAVSLSGFTLTNGVDMISYEGSVTNEDIVQEIERLKIILVWCADPMTKTRMTEIKEAYPKLKIYAPIAPTLTSDKFEACPLCQSTECHKWKAAIALAIRYDFPLNVMPH